MTELAFWSATALAAALRAREIGCRELLAAATLPGSDCDSRTGRSRGNRVARRRADRRPRIRRQGDKACIAFAGLLERASRGFVAPPGFG